MEFLQEKRSLMVLLEPPDPLTKDGPVRFCRGPGTSQKETKRLVAVAAVVRVPDGVVLLQDAAWGMSPASHMTKGARDLPRASRVVAGNL